jgi:hypothetical protein
MAAFQWILLKSRCSAFFQIAGEKIDLSDRPTNRWRTPVKGKKTPEILVRETVTDFFNSIDRVLPIAALRGSRCVSLLA